MKHRCPHGVFCPHYEEESNDAAEEEHAVAKHGEEAEEGNGAKTGADQAEKA